MIRPFFVIASEAKQSIEPQAETWIASSHSLLAMTVCYSAACAAGFFGGKRP